MKYNTSLTAKYLRSILHYDPKTGAWTWLVSRRYGLKGNVAGSIGKLRYRKIVIDGQSFFSSRLAFLYVKGRWPACSMDHIDRNPSNDRWKNLREASAIIQANNRHNCRAIRKAA